MTERLHFPFSLSCIGEGNGNPLQCSCLENPRDGWAWWAAVYGVAQRRTRLKRLSSKKTKDLYSENCKMLMKGTKWHKRLERYSMFSDWKNRYCKNKYTTQGNVHIQCNPYQITSGIFIDLAQNFSICMKHKRPQRAKEILRKKKRSLVKSRLSSP